MKPLLLLGNATGIVLSAASTMPAWMVVAGIVALAVDGFWWAWKVD